MPDTPDDTTLSQSAIQTTFAVIGPYRLTKLLGAGGMGEVWRAEQTEPIHRTVALKLIKAGMDTRAVVARFDSERQALALMEHPNIAKVFEAGATPEGRPYFVMEYVHGFPITDYCDRHRLTIKERLGLFMQVCEGVQHAHQKAIIHRDLKPSNVLVDEVDDKPVPKIIDFGLAKAMGQQLTEMTLFTEAGAMLGTPDYMSPEQADRNEPNIDTRTDVYSLGVILYELLVGELPIGSDELRAAGIEAMLRKICEQEPVRPSTKLKSLGLSAKDSAERRKEAPESLERHLRGDLDWITIRALEKDRSRRYGSASDLAGDLQRYLNDQPVSAGPPSASYRAGKFMRRHRFGVGVAAAAVVLLIGFATTMAVQARRIAKERDRANRIADFMTQMFAVSDPSEALGNAITARTILDTASNKVQAGLAKDPEEQSELMFTMARTYASLGLYPVAYNLSSAALENRRRLLGRDDRKTLQSMSQLSWILDRQGRDDAAEKLIRQTIAEANRALGPEDPVTLEAEDRLGVILNRLARFDEEEKLERQLVEISTRRFGPEDPQTLSAMVSLADALSSQSRYAEAEAIYRNALGTEQRVLGAEHPETIATMHKLANRIQEQGRYAEAESLYRQTLAIEQRVLGPEHPDTAKSMTSLANTLYYEGNTAEAEKWYRAALAVEQHALGPDHPYTTRPLEGLANVLAATGHLAEAEKLQRQVLGIRERNLGPDHTDTLLSGYNVADVLYLEGHLPEAEKFIRAAFAAQARVLGAENPDTLASKTELARILMKEGNYREAEDLARQAFESQLRVLGPQHLDTLSSLYLLGTAMVYNHRYDEAKALFEETIEKMNKAPAESVALAWFDFACVASAAHDRDEAVKNLREAVTHGFKDIDRIHNADDLRYLRGYPRYEAFLSETKKGIDMASRQPN
ncbi:MAG TPA: tetratricopeptide repeat protein [Terriglobales bacterium]|jgi:serine/threonine protein kinase/tetratricopeptide (TPR) repeat protein|nr:tetratricopeptide repeat protein [Terriglobales bacterium]